MNYRRVIATIDSLSRGITETIDGPRHPEGDES